MPDLVGRKRENLSGLWVFPTPQGSSFQGDSAPIMRTAERRRIGTYVYATCVPRELLDFVPCLLTPYVFAYGQQRDTIYYAKSVPENLGTVG